MAVAFGVYCWRRHTELEREVAERKKAQEALRQNELHLRTLVDNVPVVLFALDGDGVITASEGQGLKAFGREQNELVGQSIFDLYRDKPKLLELARRALVGEEIDTAIELAGVTLGMKSFSPRDETGKVSGVVGVGIDVTERRQAVGALQESEQRFRTLFEQFGDALLLHDEAGRMVDCNAEACRSLGYSREELLSLSVKDFAANLASGEEQLSESGMLWQHTTSYELDAVVAGFYLAEYRRKDGTTFPVEVRVIRVDYGGKRMMLASARDITRLKRAAEALRESEERYRRLVELSPETIAVHAGGELVYVNAAGARLLGVARAEELIGKPVLDLVHPDYVEFVKARIRSTREEGTTTNLAEIQMVRLDGEVIDVEIRGIPIVFEGLPAAQVVIRDITERKRIEEELRDSEERLRTIIGNVPVVLFAVDREGVFKLSEGKGLEGLGLESGEIVGRSIFEVFRDKPQILENTQRALSGEEFSAIVDLAGSTFETRYSQLRDAGGEVAGVIGVAADVTERERAMERLEESEERYRASIEQTIDSVYLGNVDTKCLIESNTAFQKMLGYTAEELRGMRIYGFIAHEEEDIDAVYQSVLEAGQRFIGERRYRRKDGTLIEVEVSATVISYDGERVMFTVARNITERKEFEEKLLETNRRLEELALLKGDFTTMVAHELYSPLVTARGYLDMLATGELEPAEQRHALDGMRSELNVLGALIADARVAATIEREDFAIQPSKVPVSALLDDAVAFAGMLPGERRLFVKAEAREQEVWADRYRVGQVLRNLLSNAANYSPDGAPIELRTMVDGDHVCVEVADRGPGIHPDDVARIFEKFGRGRDTSGQKVAGVGVGLYLSRRIMKAHGGDLRMDSTPGAGSVFGFKLEIIR